MFRYLLIASTAIVLLSSLVESNQVSGKPLSSSVQGDGTTTTFINERSISKNSTVSELVISGGDKRGNNLFHSFKSFQVRQVGVRFLADKGIKRIIARVTGKQLSTISNNLAIESIQAVDFIVINPHGFVFKEGADIISQGSFIASTASQISFGKEYHFATNALHQPIPPLIRNRPTGLVFQEAPEPILLSTISIENQLSLERSNQTLALIGGDINIHNASINGNAGNLELGAIAQGESVLFRILDGRLSLDYRNTHRYRDISISEGSTVNSPSRDSGFGNIFAYGRNLNIDQNSQFEITNNSLPTQESNLGKIELVFSNVVKLSNNSILSTLNDDNIPSNNISINANKLIISDDASIASSNFSTTSNSASSGNVIIDASEIIINGTDSRIKVSSGGTGDAGIIEILADKSIQLINGGSIESESNTQGRAGQISLKGKVIEISGSGSEISAESTRSSDAGSISITADIVNLNNEGKVIVSALGNNAGKGGNINVDAKILTLNNQALVDATSRGGASGNITIENTDLLFLNNNSQISTNAIGENNNGGNIFIDAEALIGQANSDILANADGGEGGQILVNNKTDTDKNLNLVLIGFEIDNGISPISNDIDASSNSGVQGVVSIDNPVTEAEIDLIDLPDTFVSTKSLIQNICTIDRDNNAGRSHFRQVDNSYTSNSIERLESISSSDNWIKLSKDNVADSSMAFNNLNPKNRSDIPLEASTWVRNQNGKVVLLSSQAHLQTGISRVCKS